MHVADLRQSVHIQRGMHLKSNIGSIKELHRNVQRSTYFQSTQDVDEDSSIEHWLRIDCCDGSFDFLESETLQEV